MMTPARSLPFTSGKSVKPDRKTPPSLDVDGYLASVPKRERAVLDEYCREIHVAVPGLLAVPKDYRDRWYCAAGIE